MKQPKGQADREGIHTHTEAKHRQTQKCMMIDRLHLSSMECAVYHMGTENDQQETSAQRCDIAQQRADIVAGKHSH